MFEEKEIDLRNKLISFIKNTNPLARISVLKRSNKYKDIYEYILDKTKDISDVPFSTKVYFVISDNYNYRKCSVCGKDLPHNRPADPFNGYESKFCSCRCAQLSQETRKKIETTSLKKYGTRLPQQSKEVKEKESLTYSQKSVEEKQKINMKRKKTCLEKYGTEHASQNKEIKKKLSKINRDRTTEEKRLIREKTIKTNIERYGVEIPSQSKEIKEKTKLHNIQKYGFEWAMQHVVHFINCIK